VKRGGGFPAGLLLSHEENKREQEHCYNIEKSAGSEKEKEEAHKIKDDDKRKKIDRAKILIVTESWVEELTITKKEKNKK
jgi:hypothetical protein